MRRFDPCRSHLAPLTAGPLGRRSRPPARLTLLRAPGSPGLGVKPYPLRPVTLSNVPETRGSRKDCHLARYPVSKAGGPSGLGGSTPSPSASAFRPVAQRTRAVGFEPTCRPFESGRGVSNERCDVVSTVGRPAVNRTVLVRLQPSQLITLCPDRLVGQDAGLSHRQRGFESRSGHVCSRSRTRLGMRPGCLPGEAGSIPVESVASQG